MAGRGVLFTITDTDVQQLLSARQATDADDEVMAVVEEIEERWDENWLYETDKAWDAIHRCLTDGQLEYENGEYPLNHCILGGTQLYAGDDYIISLKSPQQSPPSPATPSRAITCRLTLDNKLSVCSSCRVVGDHRVRLAISSSRHRTFRSSVRVVVS